MIEVTMNDKIQMLRDSDLALSSYICGLEVRLQQTEEFVDQMKDIFKRQDPNFKRLRCSCGSEFFRRGDTNYSMSPPIDTWMCEACHKKMGIIRELEELVPAQVVYIRKEEK